MPNNWFDNAANRAEPNFLYRNDAAANGNTNGWLLVRLIGTASNRSGIVQEIANVPANQALTVTEHQDGATNAPSLAMSNLTDGTVQLTATGQADLRYVFEASTDLAQWTKLAVRTNLTGTVEYASPTSSSPQRFYRVVVP
ncbi:MAG: hypothetical protein KJ072_06630 [Verrucomicrobia bacterium]|nr:hypothetical protein [Verrucomicrobiota bacterium]